MRFLLEGFDGPLPFFSPFPSSTEYDLRSTEDERPLPVNLQIYTGRLAAPDIFLVKQRTSAHSVALPEHRATSPRGHIRHMEHGEDGLTFLYTHTVSIFLLPRLASLVVRFPDDLSNPQVDPLVRRR